MRQKEVYQFSPGKVKSTETPLAVFFFSTLLSYYLMAMNQRSFDAAFIVSMGGGGVEADGNSSTNTDGNSSNNTSTSDADDELDISTTSPDNVDDVEDMMDEQGEFCLEARLISGANNPRKEVIIAKLAKMIEEAEQSFVGSNYSEITYTSWNGSAVININKQEVHYEMTTMLTLITTNILGGKLIMLNDLKYHMKNTHPNTNWDNAFAYRLSSICNLLGETRMDLQIIVGHRCEYMMASFIITRDGVTVYDGEVFKLGEEGCQNENGIWLNEKFVYQDKDMSNNNNKDKDGNLWKLIPKKDKVLGYILCTEKDYAYKALKGFTKDNPGMIFLTKGFASYYIKYCINKYATEFEIPVIGECIICYVLCVCDSI